MQFLYKISLLYKTSRLDKPRVLGILNRNGPGPRATVHHQPLNPAAYPQPPALHSQHTMATLLPWHAASHCRAVFPSGSRHPLAPTDLLVGASRAVGSIILSSQLVVMVWNFNAGHYDIEGVFSVTRQIAVKNQFSDKTKKSSRR